MIHVICIHCRRESHDDCINEEKGTKSWCDCHHKSGVILQTKDCNHYRADSHSCPTCGKGNLDAPDDPFGETPGELDRKNSDLTRHPEQISIKEPVGKTKREEIKDRARKYNAASQRDKETPES